MTPKFPEPTIEELQACKRISGPFSQFEDSILFEYLEPPASLNATVLLRATWIDPDVHPMNKTGKKHPQSPPLHIHFDQWESILMARGKVCTTSTYQLIETIHRKEDPIHRIAPWVPHTFYPCADAGEDTIMYMWAHPEAVPDPMDRLFFQTILGYLSDVHEKKASLSMVQVLVNQHASASTAVMFPTAKWLGPLRWWVPWQIQKLVAAVGRFYGYRGLMEKYVSPEEWEEYVHGKRS